MQDFWGRTTWPLWLAAILSLLFWLSTSALAALCVLALCLVIVLFKHLYQLRQLLAWLKKPDLEATPWGSGVWEDVFASLYQELRRYIRNDSRLEKELERLRQAARALPDGVVILDARDHIEWCNPIAEGLLGLSMAKDLYQPIGYLLRQSDFSSYLASKNFSEPITLKLSRNPDVTLELQLVPFGENQKLLICRNITHLEKIETMRRDFVANVSHELRTPLTVVGGFVETLKEIEGAVPQDLHQYLDLMEEQTIRMRNLVEDLLTLSQLESSQHLAQETAIDIPSLVSQIVRDAKNISGGRHRILADQISNGLRMRGSLDELHSAFGNLVNNAIRYTPEGGEIRLGWQLRGNEAVFSVQDTGVGIEPQHIARLTERFYRVDRSRSRETGGTGLGLSIVKHILSRHQARLEITSEFGQGSTFSAVFPPERVIIEASEVAA